MNFQLYNLFFDEKLSKIGFFVKKYMPNYFLIGIVTFILNFSIGIVLYFLFIENSLESNTIFGSFDLIFDAILSILISPILETIILILFFYICIVLFRISSIYYIIIMTVIAGIAHISHGIFALNSAISFSIFSLQYMTVRYAMGSRQAFVRVAATHATLNTCAFMLAHGGDILSILWPK